jgi:predicted PhzF superfamily epimerase YddE/YHI9
MRLFQVDAFTAKPFTGNPAAICLLDSPADPVWMQDVAAEMNLAETAYVSPRADGSFDLRWFTPALEVELCGHATLASAHVLWEEKEVEPDDDISFHTKSGVLRCHNRKDRIEMDFPVRRVTETARPRAIVDAVGGSPVSYWQSYGGYLLEYATPDDVKALQPDFATLRRIPDGYVIATAAGADMGFDFVSRFFAPVAGVDEDPVTGSAHCVLTDFWSKRSGRTDFRAYQCSKRGGVVFARLEGDRVILGGQAVTVLRGELV